MTDNNKDKGEYPPELYTATRAEYVTRVKMMTKDKKPDGCRDLFGGILMVVLAIVIVAILL